MMTTGMKTENHGDSVPLPERGATGNRDIRFCQNKAKSSPEVMPEDSAFRGRKQTYSFDHSNTKNQQISEKRYKELLDADFKGAFRSLEPENIKSRR